MQLSYDVVIHKPRQATWDYTNDPANLSLWLNDFVSYEPVSQSPDWPTVGDTANVSYTQPGGGEFTMLEKVVECDEPRHIKLLMTSKAFDMEIVNTFDEVEPGQTHLVASADFIRMGLMMKVIFFFSSKKKMLADHKRQIDKLKDLIEAT